MKKIRKVDVIIIVIVACVVFIPIFLNEFQNGKMRKLKKDVQKIVDIVSEFNKDLDKTVEYSIDAVLSIQGKEYSNISGEGVIFASKDDISVILSRDNRCAIKAPFSDDIILSEKACPTYKLIKGVRAKVSTSGDGLYYENYEYVYRGKGVNNYIRLNDELWRIVSFTEDGSIKVIRNKSLDTRKWTSLEDLYQYLNKDYYSALHSDFKKMINTGLWNTGVVDIQKGLLDILALESKKPIESKIGILSISEYMRSSLEKCKLESGKALCGNNSYLSKTMWLGNMGPKNPYYLYKDGNIYTETALNEHEVYPVLYLDRQLEVVSGIGTSENPYEVK